MGKRHGPPRWGRLTKKDLRGFDDDAQAAILAAVARGARGRVSRRGHAILRNSTGDSMSVTPDSFQSSKVVRLNLEKLFPEES